MFFSIFHPVFQHKCCKNIVNKQLACMSVLGTIGAKILNLFIKILIVIFYQILLKIYYSKEYLKSFWRLKEIIIWKNLKFKYFATRIIYNNGYCNFFNYFCDLMHFNVRTTTLKSDQNWRLWTFLNGKSAFSSSMCRSQETLGKLI